MGALSSWIETIHAGTGASKRDILVFFTHVAGEYLRLDVERVATPRLHFVLSFICVRVYTRD